MKRLLIILGIVFISISSFGQRVSEIVAAGDTVTSLTNDDYISLSRVTGSPATYAMRILAEINRIISDSLDARIAAGEVGLAASDTVSGTAGNVVTHYQLGDTPAIGTPSSLVLTNATGLVEAGLDATNSPTDNYVLTYNEAGSNFTWAADQTGGSIVVRDSALVLADIVSLYQFGAGMGLAGDTALFAANLYYGRKYIYEDSIEISYVQTSLSSGDTLNAVLYYNDSCYVRSSQATIIDTLNITGGDTQITTSGFSTTTVPEGNYVCLEFISSTEGSNPIWFVADLLGYIKRD